MYKFTDYVPIIGIYAVGTAVILGLLFIFTGDPSIFKVLQQNVIANLKGCN